MGAQKVPFQAVFGPQPPGGGVGPVGAGALGAQEFPFQKVFIPQPPGGGVGPVGAGALGAQEFPFQNVLIPQPPGGGVGPVGAGAGAVGAGAVGAGKVGQGCSSGTVKVFPALSVQVFAEAVGIERFPKTIKIARSSAEAALKRFITSSKAGHLG